MPPSSRSDAFPSAIFLHSGFRTGSTWFWHRFRQCAETYAYYEPFHGSLGDLRPPAPTDGDAPHDPSLRHPQLDAPVWQEYYPLLNREGGVTHYDWRFAYQNYYDTGANEGQARYIRHLCTHAHARGKLPVFGFCRSLARTPWFRRSGQGINIVTWRNPWDQWASYHAQTQQHQNLYFEFRCFHIACVGRMSPVFGDFFAGLDLPTLWPWQTTAEHEISIMPAFDATATADRFRIFLRVFMLDMLISLHNADLIVDLDRLTAAAAYRQEMGESLRTLCGLPDFSIEDCRLPRHGRLDDAPYVALLQEALGWLTAAAIPLRAGTDDDQAVTRIERSLADCINRLE